MEIVIVLAQFFVLKIMLARKLARFNLAQHPVSLGCFA